MAGHRIDSVIVSLVSMSTCQLTVFLSEIMNVVGEEIYQLSEFLLENSKFSPVLRANSISSS